MSCLPPEEGEAYKHVNMSCLPPEEGEAYTHVDMSCLLEFYIIRVITKLWNSEQSSKGKVKTHKYINRQNQSTTGKMGKP
jgi:hypothetical protein